MAKFPTIEDYISGLVRGDIWGSPRLRKNALLRLKRAAAVSTISDHVFRKTYQFRVITEILPSVLRVYYFGIEADRCAQSKNLAEAIENARGAYYATSATAPNAAWGSYQHEATFAPVHHPQPAIGTASYVDLMVEILRSKKT